MWSAEKSTQENSFSENVYEKINRKTFYHRGKAFFAQINFPLKNLARKKLKNF